MGKGPAVPKGNQSNRLAGSPGDEARVGVEKSKKIPRMVEIRVGNMMTNFTGNVFSIEL